MVRDRRGCGAFCRTSGATRSCHHGHLLLPPPPRRASPGSPPPSPREATSRYRRHDRPDPVGEGVAATISGRRRGASQLALTLEGPCRRRHRRGEERAVAAGSDRGGEHGADVTAGSAGRGCRRRGRAISQPRRRCLPVAALPSLVAALAEHREGGPPRGRVAPLWGAVQVGRLPGTPTARAGGSVREGRATPPPWGSESAGIAVPPEPPPRF